MQPVVGHPADKVQRERGNDLKVLVAASEAWGNTHANEVGKAYPDILLTHVVDARDLANQQFGELKANGGMWDVVLVEFDLLGANGQKAVQAISRNLHPSPVGVYLKAGSTALTSRVLASGAAAVLPFGIKPLMLGHALHLLAGGMRFSLMDGRGEGIAKAITSQLSDRELQVLAGICNGMQNKEIAHDFNVQEVTVKMHVRAIIRKMGARNRTHAAMLARDLHLV